MSSGLCGSEPYIAPEQFLGKRKLKPMVIPITLFDHSMQLAAYDARLVDIWAVAIVYYCLHFQELPWRVAQVSDGLYAAYASACANPQQSATPPTINNLNPRACRSLIRRMLEPDPKQRALIDECMSHPWVQTIEVCHMVPKPSHIHVYAQSLAQAVMRG
jgi:protein-serine/threonine kinase